MTETERYDWDLNGIWDYEDDESDEYIESYEDITKLLNEQDNRIKELESENKMLKTTISRNEAYIKRVTTKGKWSNTGDVE